MFLIGSSINNKECVKYIIFKYKFCSIYDLTNVRGFLEFNSNHTFNEWFFRV